MSSRRPICDKDLWDTLKRHIEKFPLEWHPSEDFLAYERDNDWIVIALRPFRLKQEWGGFKLRRREIFVVANKAKSIMKLSYRHFNQVRKLHAFVDNKRTLQMIANVIIPRDPLEQISWIDQFLGEEE